MMDISKNMGGNIDTTSLGRDRHLFSVFGSVGPSVNTDTEGKSQMDSTNTDTPRVKNIFF